MADSTERLSSEDRAILERKVDLAINRPITLRSRPVPDDVSPSVELTLSERNDNLIKDYGDFIEYVNELLERIKDRAIGLVYLVDSGREPDCAAAIAALYEGETRQISYANYLESLEFEAVVSKEIVAKGQGADTTYLQQLRGNAAQVAACFERKLLADKDPKEEIGHAFLTRPLIVARTTAESQQEALTSFTAADSGAPPDAETQQIYGKEVTDTFSEMKASDDPKSTILEECIPCLDRALDMDLLAPIDRFLEGLEFDLEDRWNHLSGIADLLTSEDIYDDICTLLDFFTFQCIPDLAAILSMLLWFYQSLVTSFSLDISLSLWTVLGMILGPFFMNLESIIDQYIQMIMAPIDCVIDSLLYQMSKIPSISTDYEFLLSRQRERQQLRQRKAVGDEFVANVNATIDARMNSLALEVTSWEQSQRTWATPLTRQTQPETRIIDGREVREDEVVSDYHDYVQRQEEEDRSKATIADYLRDTEEVLETGLGAVGGFLLEGRDKLNSWLEALLEDIRAFLTGGSNDLQTGIGYAVTIQRLARLIGFVKAIIRMAEDGVQCGTDRKLTDPDIVAFLRNWVEDPDNPERSGTVIIDEDNNVVIVPPGSLTAPRGRELSEDFLSNVVGGEPGAVEAGVTGITISLSDCINKVDVADLRKVEAWIKEINKQ